MRKVKRWNAASALLFAGALVLARAGAAQSNYGVISGSVRDPQHLAIAGAEVELRAASTGAVRHVATNQQGLFEAPGLLPDEYEVKTTVA